MFWAAFTRELRPVGFKSFSFIVVGVLSVRHCLEVASATSRHVDVISGDVTGYSVSPVTSRRRYLRAYAVKQLIRRRVLNDMSSRG